MAFIISFSFTFGLFCLMGVCYNFLLGEKGWMIYFFAVAVLYIGVGISMFKKFLKRD